MSTYSHTVRIGRPLDEVFAFVTDPAANPRWQPRLVRVEPHRPGRLRMGSEATEVRRFLGRELEATWTCVEHEPCTRSAIECAEGPVPFRELAANAGRLKALLEGGPAACPNE